MINVLLVDDYPVNRRTMKEALSVLCPEVRIVGEASNGQEGVDLASELNPDVILMDVRMPGMDGIQATKVIKHELGLSASVITYTGFNASVLARKAMAAGAFCHFMKPYDISDLITKVQEAAGYRDQVSAV